MNDDKDIRLDREQDEERQSDQPQEDNTVKPTVDHAMTDGAGFVQNDELTHAASPPGEDSADNNPETEGIP